MDATLLRWLVFVHVASAVAFLAAHAPSVAAMLMLRRERDPAAAKPLLEMSRKSAGWMFAALALLALSGAALATAERAWPRPWVVASIVVLVVVGGSMSPLAARPLNEVRIAMGLPHTAPRYKGVPPEPSAVGPALDRVARRTPLVMALGTLGALALVWLMAYKPGA
jgi:hypothetical protein